MTDIFGGKYSVDEVKKIMEINAKPNALFKPYNPLYRKSETEHAPSWREKREVFLYLLKRINMLIVRSLVDPRIKH